MGAVSVFPRKDPGVFDLLGSSLSCDTTGLTPPNKHLCLRVAERFRVRRSHPIEVASSSTLGSEGTSTTALRRLSSDTDAPSAVVDLRASDARSRKTFGSRTQAELSPRNARPNGRWHRSTIPSHHARAPTHFRFPADHPVTAPLRQVLAVRNLTTLKTAGQQRVAVLVADIGEVLAGHTDARRPGALQTINEVRSFLFRQTLVLASIKYPLHLF